MLEGFTERNHSKILIAYNIAVLVEDIFGSMWMIVGYWAVFQKKSGQLVTSALLATKSLLIYIYIYIYIVTKCN